MKINRRAAWPSALLCASFTFVLHAAGLPTLTNVPVDSRLAASAQVQTRSRAQAFAADEIFASGFETAPVSAPQLTIAKTASSPSFMVGTAASYTLKVTNTGTAATTASTTVNDTIPTGLTIGTLPAGCSAASQVVTCTIASGLAVGTATSFAIPVTPTASLSGTSVTNTAIVTGGGDPGCPAAANCTGTVGPTPVSAPQLTIVKTASSASFTVGTPAGYVLKVTNTGTVATTETATVRDTIPTGLIIGTLPSGCSALGQAVTCTIASGLAVSTSTSFVIPVTPTAAAKPSVTNTAAVTGGGDPSCPGGNNCTSTVGSTPVDAPQLTIVKTASSSSFTVGKPNSYTLKVTNTGAAASTATATVNDTIPSGLTIGVLPASCSAIGQAVTCMIASGLAVGTSTSFMIPVTPTAAAKASVTNTATVSGGGDLDCPAAANCTSTVGPTPVDAPQLAILKTASSSSFTVGVAASYTLKVTNTGTGSTTATATVSDMIPTGLTLGNLPAGCSPVGQTVTCTIASGLEVGASMTFVIPVTPTASAMPSVTNTATVTGGGDPACPAAANCTSTVGPTAISAPQLTILKTASLSSFTVGMPASYTLKVTNTGTAATTATATLSDTIPTGLTIGTMPAGCSATGQAVTCTIASGLSAGTSKTFVIPVTPTAAATPSVTNTATVTGGGDPACPAAANCTSTVGPTPVGAPQLALVKSASSSSFTVGTAASYTLKVTNTGTAATTATATVSDAIPSGLTIGTLPTGCSAADQTVMCTVASDLAAGASTSFLIPLRPTAAAAPSVTNTATVTGGGDPSCPAAVRCTSSVGPITVGSAPDCVPGQDLDHDGLLDSACVSLTPVPDPATVATPIDPTVVTNFADSNGFLYSGTDPVQRGTDTTQFDHSRLAVLRGRVLDENDQPLSGAIVRVLHGPEFGYTLSRADGWYDIAVNGGGTVVLDFQMQGRIRAQRSALSTPWLDFAHVDDVALIPYDTKVTTVTIGPNQDSQLASASLVSDSDGTRQSAVYFPPGVDAYLYDPSTGTSTLTDTLHVRATEFTVGSNGPHRMPASLPASSAYTYAMELSADEVAPGTRAALNFSRAVSFYTDNFLNLPIGTGVPTGYYDPGLGMWSALDNGRVVQILGVDGSGLAQIDIQGQGAAASTNDLAALGFDNAELTRIGATYAPGVQLMRFQTTHFSTYDLNYPYLTPPDAVQPPNDEPDGDKHDDDCDCESGSVIETSNAELGERIPIAGTPYFLSYRSDSSPGRTAAYTVSVSATSASLPASLQGVQVNWTVAGVSHELTLPTTANLAQAITWDGKDAYGRTLIGPRPINIGVGYVYNGVYATPTQVGQTFGQWTSTGGSLTANRTRQQITVWHNANAIVGTVDARARGLGGWAISAQHLYDDVSGSVWLGSGARFDGASNFPAINVVAGQRWMYGMEGDGIPAKNALFERIDGMATMPDGSLLIVDWLSATVSRVDRNGMFTRFLGNGQGCDQVPCVPTLSDAKSVTAGSPAFVTAGVDGCGYIGSYSSAAEIIRVYNGQAVTVFYSQSEPMSAMAMGPDGLIYASIGRNIVRIDPWSGNPTASTTVVSGPSNCNGYSGDGGNANNACINPIAMAIAKDGSIYILDYYDAVRRIGPDGIITRIAGRPLPECVSPTNYCYDHTGDGGPALNAKIGVTTYGWGDSAQIAIGDDGSIYFTSDDYISDNTVRVIDPTGIIRTLAGYAGNSDTCDDGDLTREACAFGAAATSYALYQPTGIAVARDGSVYFGTGSNHGLVYSLPKRNAQQVAGGTNIPSRSGSELYEFDTSGRHLRSANALTGATTTQLGYTGGLLSSIADSFGNTTNIQRDGSGNITITAPDGQQTQMFVDANGLAQQVVGPTNDTYTLGYTDGLLTTFQRPNGAGYASTIGYSADGLLTSDANAAGGGWTVSRSGPTSNRTVTMQSAMGHVTTYTRSDIGTGGHSFSTAPPDGSISSRAVTSDGVEKHVDADGTQITLTKQPDPRFGIAAPVIDKAIVTPLGLAYSAHTSRTVDLSNSDDPLSLTSLTDTTTVNGRVYTRAYNAGTNTWTLTSPMGRTRTVTINAQNQPLHEAAPGLATVDYHYDSRGRLDDVGAGVDPDRRDTLIGYDTNGFIDTVQDPALRTTVLTNDAVGRTKTQTLPDLRQIGFRYDADSNVKGITPPGRPEHQFDYNAVDGLGKYTPPAVADVSNPQTTYGYNPDQQFTAVTRPDGLAVTPNYNGVTGLLDHVDTPDGSYAYAWYPGHRVKQRMAPGSVQLDYTWDGALLKSVATSGPFSASVGYGYDNNFWLTHLTTPAATIDYGYDLDGLLISANVGTTTFTLARDPQNGLLSGTTLGQVSDSWGYNPFAEPTTYTTSVNGSAVLSAIFTRDALGRISEKSETVLGETHVTDYGYDTAGRLETVKINGQLSAEYTYDDNSNRKTHTVDVASTLLGKTLPCLGTLSTTVVVNGTADAQDRMTSYGNCTYQYGANGELQSRTDTATNQTTSYTYDVFGNLRHVTLPDNTQIDYVIDGQNRRIGKKINGTMVQGFVYANQLKPVAELDGSGNVVSMFVYADRANVPSYILRGGSVYRVIADHLGSPRLVIDTATGIVAQQMDYDEWGNVVSDTNPGLQPFGFAGGVYDRDTGLVRFGARDYDAMSGRWTAKDLILFAGHDENVYRYVGTNPINFFDSSGLDWVYHQSTGQIEHIDSSGSQDYLAEGGYAGHGDGVNNPDMQNVRRQNGGDDAGPLPVGEYTIESQQDNVTGSGTRLPASMRLTPDSDNDMFGRDGFLIHGDNSRGNRSASEGCIIFGRGVRGRIGRSGDNRLRVVR